MSKRHREAAIARRPTRRALIAILAAQFPKCFFVFEQRRRPLKVGIHSDILAMPGAPPAPALEHALRYYVNNISYLASLSVGAPRLDLNGNVAGVVDAEPAQVAKEKFHRYRRQLAQRATDVKKRRPERQSPIGNLSRNRESENQRGEQNHAG
jgi:ProP effector